MRLPKLFAMAFLTGFSGAMMPGPLLALTIGEVIASGFTAALWIVTGHALLELVLLLLLIAGLRAVLARPQVRGAIGLLGGAALLYMGVAMLRDAMGVQIGVGSGHGLSWPRLLLAGVAVSLANPYFTGWWATIGLGQLAQTAPRSPAEYLSFYCGHELSDYVWYALVAALLLGARQALQGAWYHWLIAACGAAIVLLALWFLYNGARLTVGRSAEAGPVENAEASPRGAAPGS